MNLGNVSQLDKNMDASLQDGSDKEDVTQGQTLIAVVLMILILLRVLFWFLISEKILTR